MESGGAELAIPATWAIATFVAFLAVWVPVVLSLVSQARSFGAMQAKLDLVIAEREILDDLRTRVVRSESRIDRVRERLDDHLRGDLAGTSHPPSEPESIP